MIQARMSATDPRLYNPGRDVAHCFKAVVLEVANRLENARWAPVREYLADRAVSDEALGAACEAFTLFVATSVADKDETMEECLRRVGWFAVPEAAQVAYMAYLGTVMSGLFYSGVREATLGGEGPVSDSRALAAAGAESHRLMAYPHSLRGLVRWWFARARKKLKWKHSATGLSSKT